MATSHFHTLLFQHSSLPLQANVSLDCYQVTVSCYPRFSLPNRARGKVAKIDDVTRFPRTER
jgi:hypothetical protein